MELTTACNASCPQCPRNQHGGKRNPALPRAELRLGDIREILSPVFLKGIAQIRICGNYGDAALAQDLAPITMYFRECNPLTFIQLHSNGGARGAMWWSDLAKRVDRCVFGLDGLADTNHIYRRGTSWTKIMENVQAFIQAGGSAVWEFIVFRHNEHQVDEAKRLSRRLGFKDFRIKRTARLYTKGKRASEFPVEDRRSQRLYVIQRPKKSTYWNPTGEKLVAEIGSEILKYQEYLDTTRIFCKAVSQKEVFITAEGYVFPCCYTALIYPTQASFRSFQVLGMLESIEGGLDAINGKLHDIKDIVRGEFFIKVVKSWNAKRIQDGRLEFCAHHCGEYDLIAGQTDQ